MSTVPAEIRRLVRQFDEHRDTYRRGDYNETQLRRDFLDPFFASLGWDVHNRQGYAEAYRDVLHEDSLRVEKTIKAPDYCFRIGGVRKFFVEAKRPSVDIHNDTSPAFQLRRYAWTAKLPLSILTDFEELAVYDCRIKPDKLDKASTARILYFTYDELPDRWEEIAGIFSREAILRGAFDKYAETTKKKRGTAEVDRAFLEEIEAWRESLARNISLRNEEVTDRELNFAVQRIIDRIIFLRMCEGRGIEPFGRLQALLSGRAVYGRLVELFHRADEKYNSGLFHFQAEQDREPPDELTTGLALDDRVLKEIIARLYYPESPYEFAALPADILGQVYEQFLGKVIRLTTGHRAKVEEKPEVRKAGGVYYTPTHIVQYIVQNTLGKMLEGKKPQEVGGLTAAHKPARNVCPLTVLDPACGSGSFLIVAYQYLLDWYLKQYTECDDPNQHARGANPRLYQTGKGDWRLTGTERKRILLSHIHGVDIDYQAVEVTKLSLLLKVLEGETEESLAQQRKLFHKDRALPDLAMNIKCGNSLIGPEFYDSQQKSLFDEAERLRINVFDWHGEFPQNGSPSGGRAGDEAGGGFDVVIGNPPWGQKAIDESAAAKLYIRQRYPSTAGIFDLFRPFVERGIELLREGGAFGMVLPDIVLLKDYPATRRYLLDHLRLDAIDWWGMAFADAVIDAATIIGSRVDRKPAHRVRVAIRDDGQSLSHEIPQSDFAANPRCVFNLHLTAEKRAIIKHLEQFPRLGDYFEIHEGVHSGNIRSELFVSERLDDTCDELLFGREEISPYHLVWQGRYIRLGALPNTRTPKRYANIGREAWHRRKKVLVRRTGDYVLAAVDTVGRFASNNFFLVFPKQDCDLDLHGLCALLNSKFMTWYFRTIEPRRGRVFAELKIKHLEAFPLPKALQNGHYCENLNRLGVERAHLAQSAAKARLAPEVRASMERTCSALDRQIEMKVRAIFEVSAQLENMPTALVAPTASRK